MPICAADCDADTRVGIAELVTAVGIALGSQYVSACRSVDRDGDAQVGIDELILAVRTSLDGCAAMLDASVAARRIYDATVAFEEPTEQVEGIAATDALGNLSGLSVYTSPNSTLELTVERDGESLTLDGYYLYTDVASSVEGSATVRQMSDVELIEGTVTPRLPSPGDPSISFVLRHSTSLSPERYAGRYEFTFDRSPSGANGESRTTIELDIGPNGTAIASEGVDVLESGLPAGTVSAANCIVAPEGSLYCSGVYLSDKDPVNRFRMTGRLELGAGNEAHGSGRFLAGYDPPFAQYVDGFWTAVRLDQTAETIAALEAVAENACEITSIGPPPYIGVWRLENGSYNAFRSCGTGHSTVADLVRHPTVADAALSFAAQASQGEPADLHGLPAAQWARPFDPPSHGGRHSYLLWQLDCWVILVHSSDDTSYWIAPQPIPFSESILTHAGDLLRAACSEQ